jgi:hypothetical protein
MRILEAIPLYVTSGLRPSFTTMKSFTRGSMPSASRNEGPSIFPGRSIRTISTPSRSMTATFPIWVSYPASPSGPVRGGRTSSPWRWSTPSRRALPRTLRATRHRLPGSRRSGSGSSSTGAAWSGRWRGEKGGSAGRAEPRLLTRDTRPDVRGPAGRGRRRARGRRPARARRPARRRHGRLDGGLSARRPVETGRTAGDRAHGAAPGHRA